MTNTATTFPFLPSGPWQNQSVYMPWLPLDLRLHEGSFVKARALLDTGATVNILPYKIGLQLGAVWEEQEKIIPLAGNLAYQEARAILVEARIRSHTPIELAFAWSRSERVPLLLGQVNFFHQYDVEFQALLKQFHIYPAERLSDMNVT